MTMTMSSTKKKFKSIRESKLGPPSSGQPAEEDDDDNDDEDGEDEKETEDAEKKEETPFQGGSTRATRRRAPVFCFCSTWSHAGKQSFLYTH
jgi:hypothetical protein